MTSLTASKFVLGILHAQNEAKVTAAIFVDLRKAFDTIDHLILFTKTSCCQISGWSPADNPSIYTPLHSLVDACQLGNSTKDDIGV